MNKLFADLLDIYIIVYLDNILIYSKNLKEHKKQVKEVLRRLKANGLYVFCKGTSLSPPLNTMTTLWSYPSLFTSDI